MAVKSEFMEFPFLEELAIEIKADSQRGGKMYHVGDVSYYVHSTSYKFSDDLEEVKAMPAGKLFVRVVLDTGDIWYECELVPMQ